MVAALIHSGMMYLKSFLCVVMVDKEHACIVNQHMQRQIELLVVVCKCLDRPTAMKPLSCLCAKVAVGAEADRVYTNSRLHWLVEESS